MLGKEAKLGSLKMVAEDRGCICINVTIKMNPEGLLKSKTRLSPSKVLLILLAATRLESGGGI